MGEEGIGMMRALDLIRYVPKARRSRQRNVRHTFTTVHRNYKALASPYTHKGFGQRTVSPGPENAARLEMIPPADSVSALGLLVGQTFLADGEPLLVREIVDVNPLLLHIR